MDVSKIFMVNQDELMAQVAKLVDGAIEKRLETYDDKTFRDKVADIITQEGIAFMHDDIDEAISDFIRNQVTIEINC